MEYQLNADMMVIVGYQQVSYSVKCMSHTGSSTQANT